MKEMQYNSLIKQDKVMKAIMGVPLQAKTLVNTLCIATNIDESAMNHHYLQSLEDIPVWVLLRAHDSFIHT